MSIKYTPFISEVKYKGQYPNIVDFAKPWETCLRASQGRGKISENGQPLQSEGFGLCSALILRNQNTLDSALFHISEWDLPTGSCPIVSEFMIKYINNMSSKTQALIDTAKEIAHYNYPRAGMSRNEFQIFMQETNKDIKAQFVFGSISRHVTSRIKDSMLNYFGIETKRDIFVNTGECHWAIVYYPEKSQILVDARKSNRVLEYKF